MLALFVGSVLATLSGCVVGQPPGNGRVLYQRESTTGAPYYLYLPQGYDAPTPNGQPRPKYPLVMTFHGLFPFDSSNAQIREWQQEADRYGYIVCAPSLNVSALFSPLPLSDPENAALKRDERCILAIMDELNKTTDVDPNHVLSTSWSYGGYVAHFMVNRHPERFSCIGVKQSNFNEDLLDESMVPRYTDRKVAIYYTENDFAICQRESSRAADWYAKRGFDVTFGIFESLGHERTPSVAAEFFARTCDRKPKTPPSELAGLRIKSKYHNGVRVDKNGNPKASRNVQEFISSRRRPQHASGPTEVATAISPYRSQVRRRGSQSPRRNGPAGVTNPVRIHATVTEGQSPLWVSFSVAMPKAMRDEADILWTQNGEPISNTANSQRVFSKPGDHTIQVLVTDKNHREFRATQIIRVREPSKP